MSGAGKTETDVSAGADMSAGNTNVYMSADHNSEGNNSVDNNPGSDIPGSDNPVRNNSGARNSDIHNTTMAAGNIPESNNIGIPNTCRNKPAVMQ